MSAEGIRVCPSKTEKIKNFPVPRNQTELKSFLGVANFYCRFALNFAMLAALMNNLLKKESDFVWTPEANKAFCLLKSKLCDAPILQYPNFELP